MTSKEINYTLLDVVSVDISYVQFTCLSANDFVIEIRDTGRSFQTCQNHETDIEFNKTLNTIDSVWFISLLPKSKMCE